MSDNNIVTYLADKQTLDTVNTNVGSVKTDVSTVNTNVSDVKNDVADVKSDLSAISENALLAANKASDAEVNALSAVTNTNAILNKLNNNTITIDGMMGLLSDTSATCSADTSFLSNSGQSSVSSAVTVSTTSWTDIWTFNVPSSGTWIICVYNIAGSQYTKGRMLVNGAVAGTSTYNDYSGHVKAYAVSAESGQTIKYQSALTSSSNSAQKFSGRVYYAKIDNVFFTHNSTSGYSRDEKDNGKFITTYTPTETGQILIAYGTNIYDYEVSGGSHSIDGGTTFSGGTAYGTALKYALISVQKDVPITIKVKDSSFCVLAKTVKYAESLKIIKRIQYGTLSITTSFKDYNITIAPVNINKAMLVPISGNVVTSYTLTETNIAIKLKSVNSEYFSWQLVEFW